MSPIAKDYAQYHCNKSFNELFTNRVSKVQELHPRKFNSSNYIFVKGEK